MDQFGHTLDALKTTAGKAMDLCQSLQAQNKAQADRIAELENAIRKALIETDHSMIANSRDIDDWKDDNRNVGNKLRAILSKG